jgi:arylsulfatase A-like enzyme
VGKGRSNVYLDIPDKCFNYLYDPKVLNELFSRVDTNWQWSPLYEEIARIPLMVYLPGQKPGIRDSLVSAVDIMPTILDLADIDVPEFVQGKSFMPVVSGIPEPVRDFTVTSYPLYNVGDVSRIVDGKKKYVRDNLPVTITDNRWSVFYTDNKTPVELYDLNKDPGQLYDISKENPEAVEVLHEKFLKLLRDAGTEDRFIKTRSELAY